jgi:1-acyl-sn-glycerol-3-phosphate acyltransferase
VSPGQGITYRVNYLWRVVATGFSFAFFGIGGLALALFVFPVVGLLSRDRAVTKRRIQRMVSRVWQFFVAMMKSMGILTWELHGREDLQKSGRLIVANHPSLLDVVFLISCIREVDCIVKPAVLRNPFMLGARWAGYIADHDAERSAEDLVKECQASLRAGNSLLIFPEGTRTRPGQAISMRRGAAQIALAAGCEILPVTIRVEPTTLTKGQPWWNIPPRPFHVTIVVGEPLNPADFLTQAGQHSLAARHLTHYLERHFTESLSRLELKPGTQP